MSKIIHRSGDEPFTIRSLVRVAEREGYDFDAPLCFFEDEDPIAARILKDMS